MEEPSQICSFFANQTIFLTGGTGYVGKLLIEKLLRVCYDLSKIYVLVRPKGSKTPEQRFKELFDNPCFDLIRNKNLEKKVSLINGDCTLPLLGLKGEDVEILKNETTCIFHAAANVKFDQSLKEVSDNVRGTKDLLELAKEMKQLKVFVYVSTLYSNCVHSHIKEEFYEPPMKPTNFFDLVDSTEEAVLKKMTPGILDKYPNTYVYSKCISEDLVKEAAGIPRVLFRPGIITNTMEEPIEGWTDNIYGPIGIGFGANMGVIRSAPFYENNKIYCVPGDHVCNAILASAWQTAEKGSSCIYNCIGQYTTYGALIRFLNKCYWEFPSEKYFWYKSFKYRTRFWHNVYVGFLLILISFIDLIFNIFRNPLRIAKKFKYAHKVVDVLSYFATREWEFEENNLIYLKKEMNETDRKIFKFGLDINWDQYLRNCALGVRLYFLKDPIETIPKGKRKLKVLFILHYAVLALFSYIMYWFFDFLILS